ncbi:MAG: cyclic nucleotide-binding domain-containing protein [Acidobacteria bacterium]|nr:MAG: cyclic nucleotide-binding domain-containing protein [Acidobacteriota bacterium]
MGGPETQVMSRFDPNVARAPLAGFSDLRAFRVFQHFGDTQLAQLAAHGRENTVPQGHVVYDEGSAGDDFFVVLAGAIEGHRNTTAGRQPATRIRVGQLFGEVSYLDGRPRDLATLATEHSVVLTLSGPGVRQAVAADPGLGAALARTFWHSLAAKIRQANQFMGELLPPSNAVEARPAALPGSAVELRPGAKLDLFAESGLSAAELRLLATTLRAESFPPGANIFLEGERGDSLYIVVGGEVAISRRIPGRGEIVLATFPRGGVFGEMALIDDQLRSADARSGPGGCTALVLSQRDLDEVLQRPSEAAAQFLGLVCRVLCHRLRAMIGQLAGRRAQPLEP